MVELDVQLTADGRLVAAHDGTLERLGGSALAIETTGLAELRQALRRATPAAPAALPELEEALDALPPGFPVNLDLKLASARRARFADALLAAIADRPNVLVSSFDMELLLRLRARAPALPLAPLADRRPEVLLRRAARLQAWSVHVHHSMATVELIAAARDGGWPVLVYTVNDPRAAAALLAAGAAGLFTDDPGALREALAGRAPALPAQRQFL